MITSRRAVLAAHEGFLANGISAWMRGDEGPDAVAASRIVAETIIMWRAILDSKMQK